MIEKNKKMGRGKPADADDGHPFTGPGFGFLERLVGGHAGAQDRGRVDGVQPIRNATDVGGRGQHVLRKAAIDGVARVLLLRADRFPACDAVFAGATGAVAFQRRP